MMNFARTALADANSLRNVPEDLALNGINLLSIIEQEAESDCYPLSPHENIDWASRSNRPK